MADKNWMQKLKLKKGALRKELGVPKGKRIPAGELKRAAKDKGKLGRRARLALVFRKAAERRAKG